MSATTFEIILARLYCDPIFRQAFLANPQTAIQNYDLTTSEQRALFQLDRTGLVMAARSFQAKKDSRAKRRPGLFAFFNKS